jgi:hypothetical protein
MVAVGAGGRVAPQQPFPGDQQESIEPKVWLVCLTLPYVVLGNAKIRSPIACSIPRAAKTAGSVVFGRDSPAARRRSREPCALRAMDDPVLPSADLETSYYSHVGHTYRYITSAII